MVLRITSSSLVCSLSFQAGQMAGRFVRLVAAAFLVPALPGRLRKTSWSWDQSCSSSFNLVVPIKVARQGLCFGACGRAWPVSLRKLFAPLRFCSIEIVSTSHAVAEYALNATRARCPIWSNQLRMCLTRTGRPSPLRFLVRWRRAPAWPPPIAPPARFARRRAPKCPSTRSALQPRIPATAPARAGRNCRGVSLSRNGAIASLSRSTRWPRVKGGSLPSVPAWRLRPLVERQFERRLEGCLERRRCAAARCRSGR